MTEPQTFPHLNTDDYRLPERRCELWNGFIFINVDQDAPSLMECLTLSVVERYSPIMEALIYQLHAEIDKLIGAENIAADMRIPDLVQPFFV